MNRALRATAIGVAAAVTLMAGAAAPALATGMATVAPSPRAPSQTQSARAKPTSAPRVRATAAARAGGAGTPAPAPRSLADIQAAGAKQASARAASLTAAISKVTANTYLSTPDRATILSILNGDLSGMNATAAAIAADTSVTQAAIDVKSIFTTYRVYAVALPQARFAAAADGLEASALPKLTAAEHKLSAALAGKYASKSTPALQSDLADMTTQIGAANRALSGLAAAALAVTPAAYNANQAVLKPFRQSLTTATTAVKQARADAKTVLAALQ